jgi:hypothetical protein
MQRVRHWQLDALDDRQQSLLPLCCATSLQEPMSSNVLIYGGYLHVARCLLMMLHRIHTPSSHHRPDAALQDCCNGRLRYKCPFRQRALDKSNM